MNKIFVIGDIHGGAKALLQCLERSNFDYDNDTLIQLGDVVDGWSETFECVEILTGIKNLIAIKGNHDDWFNEWLIKGVHPAEWMHGGYATLRSYVKYAERDVTILASHGAWKSDLTFVDIPPVHQKFFNDQVLYYIDDKNRCFVHGGFFRDLPISETKARYPHILYWDRKLWSQAMSCVGEQMLSTEDNFSQIFIGHTSTINWKDKNKKSIDYPMTRGGVTNMDTGGGWNGRLSIMDIDTMKYWQSDPVQEIYKDERGRN
jgi:serine/threonine protein phosphatase 1